VSPALWWGRGGAQVQHLTRESIIIELMTIAEVCVDEYRSNESIVFELAASCGLPKVAIVGISPNVPLFPSCRVR
jgi:hypothetical protein